MYCNKISVVIYLTVFHFISNSIIKEKQTLFASEKKEKILYYLHREHYQRIGAGVAKFLKAIELWYSTVNFQRENYRRD